MLPGVISKLKDPRPDMFRINMKNDTRTAHIHFYHQTKVKMTHQKIDGFIAMVISCRISVMPIIATGHVMPLRMR